MKKRGCENCSEGTLTREGKVVTVKVSHPEVRGKVEEMDLCTTCRDLYREDGFKLKKVS